MAQQRKKKRITHEVRRSEFEEFIAYEGKLIKDISDQMIGYYKIKKSNADPDLDKYASILGIKRTKTGISIEVLVKRAEYIAFMLSTLEDKYLPVQNVGGMMVPILRQDDSIEEGYATMHIAMELLLSFNEISWKYSKNGHVMVKSNISKPELIAKNIYLPLLEPTEDHTKLGSFDWEQPRDTRAMEALNKINSVPCRIVLLKEDDIPKPINDRDFSSEAIAQREKHEKQIMRKKFGEEYAGKDIYFNYAIDHRLRFYSVGYYANPQGDELEKSSIRTANPEMLNIQGIVQLKKSLASAYGLDKKTDREKMLWFMKNEKVLHLRARHAKEPYTFQMLLDGWRQYKRGEPVDVFIELDATNSQAQVQSLITKDLQMAKSCNVAVNHDGPKGEYDTEGQVMIKDLYKEVAEEMMRLIKKEYADE